MIYGYFTYAVAGIVGFVIALCIGLFVRKCDDIIILVLITTSVSRSPFSGVADNNKFFCGWQKMGVY